MKSVILCEGKDDLWFIGYYLHKTRKWEITTKPINWENYKVSPLNRKQEVNYLTNGEDSVAIWSVGGKDSFSHAVDILFEKFINAYPSDPINSIVIMRDRDNESISTILQNVKEWFAEFVGEIDIENKSTSIWSNEIDGIDVAVKITPLIIPFSEEGAIETILMNSISESSREGQVVVDEAKKYVNTLCDREEVGTNYLTHERLILKAKYSAVIAVTNPDHSTGLFQDMVISSPWENSEHVKEHFDVIVKAISSNVE